MRPEEQVAAWNAAVPVGSRVLYYPLGLGVGTPQQRVTRSPAQVVGGHTAVVWVEGVAGCLALSHLQPVARLASVAALEAESDPQDPMGGAS